MMTEQSVNCSLNPKSKSASEEMGPWWWCTNESSVLKTNSRLTSLTMKLMKVHRSKWSIMSDYNIF